MALVLLINVATTFINKDSNSSLTDALLVFERRVLSTSRHFAHIVSIFHYASLNIMLVVWRFLKHVISFLKYFLLDDVLVEHLVVEVERFLVDEIVV